MIAAVEVIECNVKVCTACRVQQRAAQFHLYRRRRGHEVSRYIDGITDHGIHTRGVALRAGDEHDSDVLIVENTGVALTQEQGLLHQFSGIHLDCAAISQWQSVNKELRTVGIGRIELFQVIHQIEVDFRVVAEQECIGCSGTRRLVGYHSLLHCNLGHLNLHGSLVQLVLAGLVILGILFGFVRSAGLSATCTENISIRAVLVHIHAQCIVAILGESECEGGRFRFRVRAYIVGLVTRGGLLLTFVTDSIQFKSEYVTNDNHTTGAVLYRRVK